MITKLTPEVAATLLKMAKTTSDPNVAAALVNKAADIKERLDDGWLSPRDCAIPFDVK